MKMLPLELGDYARGLKVFVGNGEEEARSVLIKFSRAEGAEGRVFPFRVHSALDSAGNEIGSSLDLAIGFSDWDEEDYVYNGVDEVFVPSPIDNLDNYSFLHELCVGSCHVQYGETELSNHAFYGPSLEHVLEALGQVTVCVWSWKSFLGLGNAFPARRLLISQAFNLEQRSLPGFSGFCAGHKEERKAFAAGGKALRSVSDLLESLRTREDQTIAV
ncbi:MAG: hypothetical protein WD898_00450 [Candidatus Paceibacterota bacterium]